MMNVSFKYCPGGLGGDPVMRMTPLITIAGSPHFDMPLSFGIPAVSQATSE